ncbi:hypothetical protein ACSHWO_02810 [Streptomyces sp. HUAS TT3]|uniref:hypothetical protein n=1 Tax=Streptomyces sp. HUAS TT3 TaxID=3447510 RepID=UPI003F655C9C
MVDDAPVGDGPARRSLNGVWLAVAREITAALDGVPAEQAPERLCGDPTALRLAEIQFPLGEGPGVSAAEVFAPVLAPDLATDARRWPLFVPQALLGCRADEALPLRARAFREGRTAAEVACRHAPQDPLRRE